MESRAFAATWDSVSHHVMARLDNFIVDFMRTFRYHVIRREYGRMRRMTFLSLADSQHTEHGRKLCWYQKAKVETRTLSYHASRRQVVDRLAIDTKIN